MAQSELDEILKKLWEIDIHVFRALDKLGKEKNLHTLKLEKARFGQFSKLIKNVLSDLETLTPTLKTKALKDFSQSQLEYFQILMGLCESQGDDFGISPEEFAESRKLAFHDATKMVRDLVKRLKK